MHQLLVLLLTTHCVLLCSSAGDMLWCGVQAAAAAGQLEVLRWAHSQQPPLKIDAWASRAAAANGHVCVLQWLRAHSYPWDAWTTRAGEFALQASSGRKHKGMG
jgi:hypothetical protein